MVREGDLSSGWRLLASVNRLQPASKPRLQLYNVYKQIEFPTCSVIRLKFMLFGTSTLLTQVFSYDECLDSSWLVNNVSNK